MQRYPVRVQIGDIEPQVVGWIDMDEHDGSAEVIAHVSAVLRKVADEFDEQQRYSRYERD